MSQGKTKLARKMPIPVGSSTPKRPDRPFWFNKFEDNPDLNEWVNLCNQAFFHGKLQDRVQIAWNGSMSKTAGKCFFKRSKDNRQMYAKILLSGPLLKQTQTNSFAETLIHEMIHAYVGLVDKPLKREVDKGHGPIFLGHMERINAMTGLKITVRHQLYEEMHAARPYWWACDGPCRLWPPYHGLIKKSNKALLTKIDTAHHKECPGTFHRIRVPPPTEKPKKTKVTTSSSGRPSLVVRKSLMVPTPISKQHIFIVRKKAVHPPTPRTAQAALKYLRHIKCPIPETALQGQLQAIPLSNPVIQAAEKISQSLASLHLADPHQSRAYIQSNLPATSKNLQGFFLDNRTKGTFKVLTPFHKYISSNVTTTRTIEKVKTWGTHNAEDHRALLATSKTKGPVLLPGFSRSTKVATTVCDTTITID